MVERGLTLHIACTSMRRRLGHVPICLVHLYLGHRRLAERQLPKNVTTLRLCETWGKMVPGISLNLSLCGLKAVHNVLHDV